MSIFSEEEKEFVKNLVKRYSTSRKTIREKNEQLQKLAKEIEEANAELVKTREDELQFIDKLREHHSIQVINEEVAKLLN